MGDLELEKISNKIRRESKKVGKGSKSSRRDEEDKIKGIKRR